MPSWRSKRERQYEHIKKSQTQRGTPAGRAKEIAARTVNKARRQSGETPKKQTQGTGNPRRSLEDRPRDELYNVAKKMNIEGRSKMNKGELVREIRSHG